MMTMTPLLLILTILVLSTTSVESFSVRPALATRAHTFTHLFMSDVPDENENPIPPKPVAKSETIQPPEDMMAFTGDMLVLSIYTMTDHFLGLYLPKFMIHHAKFHPGINTLPVWMDTSSTPSQVADQIRQSELGSRLVASYSPLFQEPGTAVVLLSVAWILAGLVNEAFSYKHTVQCRTEMALLTTLTTWLTMMGITLIFLGLVAPDSANMTDIMFVADSFAGLTMWRFLQSSIFGRGN